MIDGVLGLRPRRRMVARFERRFLCFGVIEWWTFTGVHGSVIAFVIYRGHIFMPYPLKKWQSRLINYTRCASLTGFLFPQNLVTVSLALHSKGTVTD